MGQYKPKLILLESNDLVRDHAKSILIRAGWDVFCHQVSKDALDMLEQSREYLFALFISNFKLPEMEGDDILEKVKSISPVTQRMLIVPADRADILINAVNKAEIHACITFPFKDEDLIAQAGNCFKQFKMTLKRQRLKRVTAHQNKQMLEIAQKLKKKDDTYKELIEGKKEKKLTLASKIGKAERQKICDMSVSLAGMLEKKEVNPLPNAFYNEFLSLCTTIQDLFTKAISRRQPEPVPLNLEDILGRIRKTADGTLPKNEPVSSGLMEKILNSVFMQSMEMTHQDRKDRTEPGSTGTEKVDHFLDPYFKITVSDDRTKAYIEKIKEFDDNCPVPTVKDILALLREKQLVYGILDDDGIQIWISSSSFAEKIVIAQGEKPVYGQDGKIEYHFKTNFTNPGKINEDGTIDFRERGDIPYVLKGALLAEKTPPKQGRAGITVTGAPITVDEPVDPVFLAGSGAELSEDKLSICAVLDGQPHRDALGTISINPDLIIPGDIDFETGNIDFKGNIIVKGMVREGFSVKGINLTAKEIEGAFINISGDLNVSAGITDSKISAHGHIYAKYVNHSTIMGFQDLVIQKEIIDSDILLSGSCKNPTGHIISSRICAKLGIEAGKIGTSSSAPCKLKIGVDNHIETLKKQINEAMEGSLKKTGVLKSEIRKLEDQDQALYREISEKAHIQDRTQLEIKELKKALPDLQKSNDIIKLQEATHEVRKLLDRAKAAEKALNVIFDTQDKLANQIEQLKTEMGRTEEQNKAHMMEQQALASFSKKELPVPVLTVTGIITTDNHVKGPHTSIMLKENRSRCRIQEITTNENGMNYHEMIISDL